MHSRSSARAWFALIGRFLGIMSSPADERDGAHGIRQWSGRLWLTVVAGLVVVAAGVGALVVGVSGSTNQQARAQAATGYRAGATQHSTATQPTIPPVSVSARDLAKLPRATTFTSIPAAPLDLAPFATTSGLVVHPLSPQALYAGPGKRPIAVLPVTELGGPTWVPMVQTSQGWTQVLLPSRPNRATGWIYTGGSSGSRLEIRSSAYVIRIQLGARKLSVDDGSQSLGTWTVAVGTSRTPTPTGRTFLLASLAPPHPTYSPLILPLGSHSNVFSTFGGGPGTVGLHGWPDPSVFGHAISNGCVRVPADALRVLSSIPLGSLVLITQ
jgi:lipoprotein-anchoring transpeptidase ErfK/SrfK